MAGWITGPQGDPGRIRQAAQEVENLSARYDGDRRAIDEAVDGLLHTWQGDSAIDFHAKWYRGAGTMPPTALLAGAKLKLDAFAKQLYDYADELEHAQHDHWIQMALMVGLTLANVAQLGLDPASDAAEVGLASVGTMALRQGAIAGFSDLAGQAGADLWDHVDAGFDRTGDHAVSWFDPGELVLTSAAGAFGGTLLAGGARALVGVRNFLLSGTDHAVGPIGFPKPAVVDPKLQNIADDLYKGTANTSRVGSGSTADAVRNELRTGQPTNGRFHFTKAEEYIRGLSNWLRDNPSAPPTDVWGAQGMLQDLIAAMSRQ